MTIQMIVALVVMFIAVVIVLMPNKYIDTSTCKRNWAVILTILSCAAYFTKQDGLGLFFLSLLGLGIFINYAFPFLLNVLRSFNWKSDP